MWSAAGHSDKQIHWCKWREKIPWTYFLDHLSNSGLAGVLEPIPAGTGWKYTKDRSPDHYRVITQTGRQPFKLTFTPTGNLESPVNVIRVQIFDSKILKCFHNCNIRLKIVNKTVCVKLQQQQVFSPYLSLWVSCLEFWTVVSYWVTLIEHVSSFVSHSLTWIYQRFPRQRKKRLTWLNVTPESHSWGMNCVWWFFAWVWET